MDRRDLLAAVLAVRVVVVGVGAHRTGPVERADGGDVVELGGGHATQQVAHRPAVELEHPERLAAGEQLVGGLVVETQVVEVERGLAVERDVVQGVVDDREVAQAQEVHLEQAEGLADPHVELRDDRAVGLAPLDRDDVDQRFLGHDHAGGVHAPLPLEALEVLGGVDDLLDLRVGLVERPHLGGLGVALVARVEHAGERDVLAHHGGRHGLGDAVGHRVAGLPVEHPCRVLDRGLRLDRGVGDDLGDLLLAVLLGDVADHLAAPALVEVHVDVGHGDALGVEEPLEDQLVVDRVEVGDAQDVGDQRARRGPAAGADAQLDRARVVEQVGRHQEVAREAHLHDDRDLVLGLLAVLLRDTVREAPVQPPLDLLDEPARLGLALGHRGHRHQVAPLGELHVDAFGDREGVVAGLGEDAVPLGAHLGGALQVEVLRVELEPVRVVHGLAGLHAEQDLVGLGVLGVGVVQVVGGQTRQVELLLEVVEVVADPALDLDAVVHQLHEEVLGAEDVAVVARGLARAVEVVLLEEPLDLPDGHPVVAMIPLP